MLYGVCGSLISAGAVEGGVGHPYLINDNKHRQNIFLCKLICI